MTLSLILDVRTAGHRLPRQLHALQRLARHLAEPIELLATDNTGDARLPRLMQRYGARLLPCQGTPLGDRLNTAVARSQGSVLVFPAPDLRLPHHWLARAAERIAHQQGDVMIFASRSLGPLDRLRRRLQGQPPTETLCVARPWFERIGGFDPALDLDAVTNLLERLRACQARIERSPA
ncbi:glycosyltransferase family A protein [Halomonas sp. NO4]|uniref:glycosyltransferase family A protein n=1 Tax=Halomonas sp. NO4 TaxID=2484813 RepID=UPI0013D666DF|nr:glycosyltransferase family A protein [Halomonas sp. NO4]